MIKPLCVLAVAVQLGVSAAYAAPKIERIAPESSIVVISIDNWSTTSEHLKSTPMWSLWQSPELAAMRDDFMEDYEKAVEEMFLELGVEGEELPMPTGAAGFSLYVQIDEELAIPKPGFIAFADFGDNADKIFELFDAALKRGEEDGEIEFEQKEVLGRTMTVITMIKPDEPEEFEFQGGMDPMMPMPDPDQMFADFDNLHVVRDGTSMLVGTHELIVTDALEAIDGDEIPSVGSNEEFQRLQSRLGPSEAYGIVLTKNLGTMMPPQLSMMGFTQIAKLLFGDITGAGLAMRIEDDAGTVKTNYFIAMPNGKSGVPALMDTPSRRGALPAFISPDALSYGTTSFEFDGLWPLINKVIQATPMLAMQMPPEQLAQLEQTITQITSALGTDIYTTSTATRPFTAESLQALYAIKCIKPEQINALLAEYAPMISAQPRDFLGHTVYSIDSGGMMPAGFTSGLSLVTAGGFAFVGSTSAVEQALRSLGGDAVAAGGAETQLTAALAMLPDQEMVNWGYVSLADQIILQREITLAMQKEQIEQWKEFDPEYAKEMEDDLAKEMESPFMKMDGDVLRRHLGPLIWSLTSTDDGFEGHMTVLPPMER